MGHKEIKIINQAVDTLVLHFYNSPANTFEEIQIFNQHIEELKQLKQQAMTIKARSNQDRYVVQNINGLNNRVMATSTGTFNVVLQNGDFSTSFCSLKNLTQNPCIKVEFRAEFLARMGYKNAIKQVERFVKNFIPNYRIKVSRIDLCCDIQGYTFKPTDLHKLKTSSRNKTDYYDEDRQCYYYSNNFTGFDIGKGAEMLRIYNKTLKIKKDKKTSFIKPLKWEINPDYDSSKEVWRVEMQFRRAKLKELVGSYGVLDSMNAVLSQIPSLWRYGLERFALKDIKDHQAMEHLNNTHLHIVDGEIVIGSQINSETVRKRFYRAKYHPVWKKIFKFKGYEGTKLNKYVDPSTPEKDYVINAYKALQSTLTKLLRGNFCKETLFNIIREAEQEEVEKKGLTTMQQAKIKALDYVSALKVSYTRKEELNIKPAVDGFSDFERDLKNNLFKLTAPSFQNKDNFFSFEEYFKAMMKMYEEDYDLVCKKTSQNVSFNKLAA